MTSRLAARVGIYGFLLLAALYFLAPLNVVIVTALKPIEEIRLARILALPQAPTLNGFVEAWTSACTGIDCRGIQVGFWNSVTIVVPSLLISVLISAFNGYALARWNLKRANQFLTLFVMCSFIPYQVILFPLVKIYSEMGLYGSLGGIVLIHITMSLPMLSLLFRNFYAGVPEELVYFLSGKYFVRGITAGAVKG